MARRRLLKKINIIRTLPGLKVSCIEIISSSKLVYSPMAVILAEFGKYTIMYTSLGFYSLKNNLYLCKELVDMPIFAF
jgi:hypothetical protein